MDYGELKTAVASDSHRSDLTTEIPRFIRQCESDIRRKLIALTITGSLGEADRSSGGIYNLPTGLQQIRAIHYPPTSGNTQWALEFVGPSQIRNLDSTALPYWYTPRASNQVEIRGTPATDTTFTLEYLGYPDALADDADTNELLTNHEQLYLSGSLFYLYKHTQDFELAQGELDVFNDVLKTLNEQYGRKHGGASTAGAYNLYGGQPAM